MAVSTVGVLEMNLDFRIEVELGFDVFVRSWVVL